MQGYASAQYCLGLMYENGIGISKDLFQSKYWMKKAYESGIEKAKQF